jgi:hypothetical protein
VKSSNTWGPADSKGNWRSNNITLPDGHYKLFAKQTQPITPGGEKQKVFWVECGPSGSTGTTGGNNGGGNGNNAGGNGNGNNAGGNGNGNNAGGNGNGNNAGGNGNGGSSGSTGGNGSTETSGSTGGNGEAVAGFQSPPSNNNAVGAVTPVVEMPGGSNQLPPSSVQGVQTAPVAGVQNLPSTSTESAPAIPLAVIGLGLMGLGGALLRRRDTRI